MARGVGWTSMGFWPGETAEAAVAAAIKSPGGAADIVLVGQDGDVMVWGLRAEGDSRQFQTFPSVDDTGRWLVFREMSDGEKASAELAKGQKKPRAFSLGEFEAVHGDGESVGSAGVGTARITGAQARAARLATPEVVRGKVTKGQVAGGWTVHVSRDAK